MRTAALAILVFVFAVGAAAAAGGIYIDNVQVTNNGTVILSDTFDNTTVLRGWIRVTDACIVSDPANSRQGALFLNMHGSSAATAYHNVADNDAGLVEMSMAVYCTPSDEQFKRRVKKEICSTYLRLHSSAASYSVNMMIRLNPCQSTYQLAITSATASIKPTFSKEPVLKPGKWALLTLRLDAANRLVTVLLEGEPIVTAAYDPSQFPHIQEVALCTEMGDGAQRTD